MDLNAPMKVAKDVDEVAATKLKLTGETRAGGVLARMREDIIGCFLKPGEKLRFEALRTRYAVSFSTLREALSHLASEGLVISEEQRGFIVAPVSVADLDDLTDMRVVLEKEALSRAIDRGDDRWEGTILSTFHRMDRLQHRLGQEYYLSAEWAAVHGEFHLSLVLACASPTLLEMRKKLFERAHRYRRMSSQFRPQWREKDVEHKMIADAALNRDASRALALVERHIRETTENVIRHAGHLFSEADAPRLPRPPAVSMP